MMRLILGGLLLAAGWVYPARAQNIEKIVGGAMAFNLMYRHAYASTNGFAAQVLVSIPETNGPTLISMRIEQSGPKLRGDFKLTSFSTVPEHIRRFLERLKLDELTAIYDLDSGRSLVLFPQVRAFLVLPPSAENVAGASLIGGVRVQRRILGPETIQGVEFRKVMLVEVGDTEGPLVWEQVDHDHFPLLIEINAKGGKTTMETKSVDLNRPAPERFGVPADYTRHADLKSLVAAAAQKAGISVPAQPAPARPE